MFGYTDSPGCRRLRNPFPQARACPARIRRTRRTQDLTPERSQSRARNEPTALWRSMAGNSADGTDSGYHGCTEPVMGRSPFPCSRRDSSLRRNEPTAKCNALTKRTHFLKRSAKRTHGILTKRGEGCGLAWLQFGRAEFPERTQRTRPKRTQFHAVDAPHRPIARPKRLALANLAGHNVLIRIRAFTRLSSRRGAGPIQRP
jgi:hypothetical protein